VKKDSKIFIGHILESINLIEEYAYHLTKEKFETDHAIQDAIIRRLEIIGEAVKNIETSFKTKHPDIPWKKIAGMRDMLIHKYFDIDLSLTWTVIKRDLPSVKEKLQEILDS
jgi:uncharacterized protein with HEPN domain